MTNIVWMKNTNRFFQMSRMQKFWKNIYIFRNTTNPPTNYSRIKLGVHTIERVYIETP